VTAFRIAAFMLPAAAAFLAPALWTWRRDWKPPVTGVAALVGIVFLWGILAGAPMGALLAVSLVSLSFAVFALGLSMVAGQVVSGLVVVLLCSTLFLAPAVVKDAVGRGGPDVAQARMDVMMSLNPWATLASAAFRVDLLRDYPSMYRMQLADYVEARPPGWGGVAAGYAVGGFILGAAALASRRTRGTP
jgi:hypothetical protein